ncbi:MAG: beta-lactamase family protein, partial [Lachnospiraceae bacterium]|nr:beta-lactamase family protein [Lachnospiraceae bacterium]
MKKITAEIAAIVILVAMPVTAAYGADKETTPVQTEVKADTVSAVGSISKIFCTTAALQLYERGLLDIDAPVTDYVPEFTMQDERYKDITVRMLMNHTSGLMGMVYDDMMLYDNIDTTYHDRFLGHLKNARLKADPGTLATYSNDGFTLLEIVVERVSGESFTDYVENHISKPLKLENTGTGVKMYGSKNTAKIFVGGVPYDTDYCMAFGSGGIMSTASELCEFGAAFFKGDETLLGQSSKDEMQKNNARDKYENAFGLGWDTVDVGNSWTTSEDVQIMFKGGSLLHQYAGLMVAPNEQISVSVTMNGASSGDAIMLTESLMISALAEKGITVTFDEPEVMETVDKVPEKYLKMADIYANEDGIFKVEFLGGKYMVLTEITAENPKAKRYMYTADDSFVLMEGEPNSDNFVQAGNQELLTFTERNGNTYICKYENTYADGFGRYIDSSYYLQRAGEFNVNDSIQQAWTQRNGKKYYMTNMKYSNAFYNVSPCVKLNVPEDINGCAKFAGGMMFQKTVSFTNENKAEGFVLIPGEAGRDLIDFE